MKIVAISDTHGLHDHAKIPECDVLVHAGDCTNDLGQRALREFATWFEAQPAKHKILIAGNHDGAFEKWPDLARSLLKEYSPSTIYLQDSGCEIDGVKFWGSPVTPEFFNWHFNRKRGDEIKRHWDIIPEGIDVLITHGPPFGILDLTNREERVGCTDLYDAILRVKPQVHLFGHIHYSYGVSSLSSIDNEINALVTTKLYNCSFLGENYKPRNKPHVIDIAT